MRKISVLFLILVFSTGCATYKFHHGKAPYNKGYVVSRDDYAILEYTLGKDSTVPNLAIAKERFKRRRDIVEDYYKRMGYIENRAKMIFCDPAVFFLKLVGGIFRLPFIAISDFHAEHNPAYKAKLDKLDEEKEVREAARIKGLKEKLNAYIQKDLEKETLTVGKPIVQRTEPVAEEKPMPSAERPAVPLVEQQKSEEPLGVQENPAPVVEQPKAEEKELVQERTISVAEQDNIKPIVKKKEKIAKIRERAESVKMPGQPVAVIVANPVRGYSPLKVHFSGTRSHVPRGRIIAYSWDFGDGDTSTSPNPVNSYYSTNFMPQDFTATLTVQDDKGNTATATVVIQVLNK